MSRKKTKAERFAQGDTRQRGKKKLAAAIAAEVRVEDGLPEVSPRLVGESAEAYAFLRLQLILSGIAAQVDVYALERVCVALATCWRADRALQREGAVIRTPVMSGRGRRRKRVAWKQTRNKWLNVRIENEKVFRIFANQFGIAGPVTRNGLEVPFAAKREHGMSPGLWEMLNRPRTPRAKLPEQIAWEEKQAEEAKPKEPPTEPEPVQ